MNFTCLFVTARLPQYVFLNHNNSPNLNILIEVSGAIVKGGKWMAKVAVLPAIQASHCTHKEF